MRREKRSKTTCEHEERSHGIPEEIMVEILTRLPAKSLLQFRCVCKSWKTLITSPNFISAHLTRISSSSQFPNKNDDSLLILRQQICLFDFDKRNVYSLRRDVEGLPEYRSIDPPPYWFKYGSKMVGSCGGLVCLVDYGCHYGDGPTRLVLWNPLLKKCFMLPDPPASHGLDIKRHHFFGFGFDPQSNDFKVVMVVTRKEGNSGVPAKVGIYSLNSRSWKSSFIELGPPLQRISQERPVILNGVVHFLANQEVHGNKQTFVFTYNPSNDSFDKMMLPWSVAIDFHQKSMCSYDNCLTLILLAYKHWEVWVMEEYGVPETWVKKFDFEIKRGLCQPIGFTKNGEMLVERWRTKLDSLNPQTYRIKNLKIEGRRGDFVAFRHVESLVLLDEPYQDVSPKVASNTKNEREYELVATGSASFQACTSASWLHKELEATHAQRAEPTACCDTREIKYAQNEMLETQQQLSTFGTPRSSLDIVDEVGGSQQRTNYHLESGYGPAAIGSSSRATRVTIAQLQEELRQSQEFRASMKIQLSQLQTQIDQQQKQIDQLRMQIDRLQASQKDMHR